MLVVIGLVMSMQSVSLITGSGPVWTGVAVVAAGTAVAFFLLSLANALYIENELSDKRDELLKRLIRRLRSRSRGGGLESAKRLWRPSSSSMGF